MQVPENRRSPDVANIAQLALQALDDVVADPYLCDLKCDLLPELIGLLTQIENFPLAADSSVAVRAFRLTARLNLPGKCAASQTAARLRRRVRDLVVVACCRRISPVDREAVVDSLTAAFGGTPEELDLETLMIARAQLFGKADRRRPGVRNPATYSPLGDAL